MALTGMDIFKLLPKTNCQDCGVATCLAFAMKLAAGQAELDACPHLSDETRDKLEEASAPPVRQVSQLAPCPRKRRWKVCPAAYGPGKPRQQWRHQEEAWPCSIASTVA